VITTQAADRGAITRRAAASDSTAPPQFSDNDGHRDVEVGVDRRNVAPETGERDPATATRAGERADSARRRRRSTPPTTTPRGGRMCRRAGASLR
jgi:hypothetical protein